MRRLRLAVMAGLCFVALASCALLPFGQNVDNDDEQADARMAQIAEAVNDGDDDALKGLFSTRALETAADFDDGLAYFLSLFPDGGLTWERDHVNASVSNAGGKKTELLSAAYRVSADGKDYWLLFKDFTVNDAIDPDNVGLFGLGATPFTDDANSNVEGALFCWANSIEKDGVGEFGYSGIYFPDDNVVCPSAQGDARMEQLAAALDSRDATVLTGMFSSRALKQSTGLQLALGDVLSYFPDGTLTWEREVVNSDGDDAGRETKLLTAQYKVSVGGKDYWLFFADFAVDAADPENVGLAALAVTNWVEPGDPSLDPEFGSWASAWILDSKGPYGVYVPD